MRFMKKSLLFTLVLALLLPFATIPTYAAGGQPRFTGVPSTHWAVTEINKMAEGGLISGYGSGLYGPSDKVK